MTIGISGVQGRVQGTPYYGEFHIEVEVSFILQYTDLFRPEVQGIHSTSTPSNPLNPPVSYPAATYHQTATDAYSSNPTS